MKRVKIFSIIIILIIIIGAGATINYTILSKNSEAKPIHFGVTYGGDNSEDAKKIIDKVKDYTNLFVVASGELQNDIIKLEDVCDYAVNSGLDIIVYFGAYETQSPYTTTFLASAHDRWGSHFSGVYYGDEPGGKILDGEKYVTSDLGEIPNLGRVGKSSYSLRIIQSNGSIDSVKEYTFAGDFAGMISSSSLDTNSGSYNSTTYLPDGRIVLSDIDSALTYWPNGTVSYQKGTETPVVVAGKGGISQFEPYQKVWDSRPLSSINDSSTIATAYVNVKQKSTSSIRNQSDLKLFTSDYALYWWNYKSSYDTVFAQLGWNNTAAQEIGLVRGAANLQGKNWGTIITWKYDQAPYLASGDEIYQQMKESYECGAEYVIVFNYAEEMSGPYGTLKDEHFQALERFWNDVVKNPSVAHGGVKAEAVLVLPKDYGWGMRNKDDKIWGLWKPDGTSEQIWSQLQQRLDQYGLKLDIVYDDPAHPVEDKYANIYYWNQAT